MIRLVPLSRNVIARNRQAFAGVHDGASANHYEKSIVESYGGNGVININASSSSQVLNQRQVSEQKYIRTLLSGTVVSNCSRNTRRDLHTSSLELHRWRNVPHTSSRLGSFGDRVWLGYRYNSADAHSDSESKKGLQESQIGQELLSDDKEQSSAAPSVTSQELKLAHGETLSPEEEAILKEAEAEYESAQREEDPISVESIQEMLKDLSAVADPKDPRIAIVSLRLGQEYEARGEDPKTFLKLGEQALSIFQTAGEFSLEIGMCYHLIALAQHRLGQQHLSLENLYLALSLLKDNEEKESAPVKFAVQFLLGDTLSSMGKHEEALQHYVAGLAVQETIMDESHPQLASNYRQVGEAFTQVMLFDEAKALVEKALESHIKINGQGSMDEAIDRRLLSVIYSGLEEHNKALEEQLIVKSILNEKNLESEAVFVDIAIADTQVALGRFDDAIVTLQNAISHLEEGSSMRVLATVNLAKAYTQQRNNEKAEEHSREAIAILNSKLEGSTGGDSTELLAAGECYTELAAIYQHMNQPDEAISLLEKGLSIYKQLPQQLNATAGSQAQIGMLLLFNRRVHEAIPYMEEAAANLRLSFGAGHYSLALVLNHLAVAHVELKNLTKAVELFEEAKSIYIKTHGPGQQDTLSIYYNLMKVYGEMSRKEEAIANATHIVAELEKKGEPAKDALAAAQKDLADLEGSQSISPPEST